MGNTLRLQQAPEIKFFESAEYQRRIQAAQYRMRPQPFVERFTILNTIAKIGTLFFPTISVLTGIAFIYNYAFGVSGSIFISIAFAVIVLSFLELIKNNLLNNGLDTFFSNSGKPALIFLFALVFSIGSFIMSYQGAELLVKNLDKSKQSIIDNTSWAISKIKNKYNKAIELEQSKITAIRKKANVQWHGLNTPEQNKLILTYENNIKQFRSQEQKETDLVLSDKKESIIQSKTTIKYNAYVFKVFAAINEFLTLSSIVFVAFYAFKTVRQHIDLTEFKENPNKYNELPGKVEFQPLAVESLPKQNLNSIENRQIIKGFLKEKSPSDNGHGERYSKENNKRTCKHCGQEFKYLHWNKQYCSDDCRMEHWEQKTGKKLTFKKSK